MNDIKQKFEEAKRFFDKGDLDKVVAILSTISREDSAEQYARAQINLGITLGKQGKVDEEIETYRNVNHEDSAEQYAKAQLYLGVTFREQGKVNEAIEAYRNVNREDSAELYARAQINLGITLGKQGKVDEEIEAYRNVTREDSAELYARAQINLGITLGEQGKVDEEIKAYRNVNREDSAEQYARAQLNLGITLGKQGKFGEEIEAYRNVTREDSAELYVKVQFLLGLIFESQDKLDEAREAFNNIKSSDDVQFYTKAQVYLKILRIKSKEIRTSLFDVYSYIDDILNLLRINNPRERHIAHYTRPSTLFRLLPNEFSKDRQKDIFSRFRLSSINGVNDPTEGKILFQYLGINELEDSYITFISCFTFNHDSLNQFRLYGKENNKEVTGVSTVFDGSKFFEQSLDKSIALDYGSKLNKETNDLQEDIEKEKRLVDKLPLYRCIYIDPESDYLGLARREDITFYREKETTKKDLQNYNRQLSESNKQVTKRLKEIKFCIGKILSKNANKQNIDELLEVISEIILPLRYLVKHVAFKEEQECRMVYISPLDNPKIILDTEYNQTYVEYAVPVKENIHRVYLSQGANIYKESFRILLGENKVKSSSNPFRNKD
ncbi:tetratricopeptide repeat protein [Actinobacillus genomosp. 1]|uniref:tetratricopeptide repeat protein n=1 Tax=Actinobacillus genomosp. 1 TaxID=254839 RepID=UPI0024427D94|nr:tetratricopeptide repeat protein [Actinobacillus genomosp. 1]WGE34613.1 tetratricopeptide repeat protein [Actinobacillus genomosp. 1]